MKTTELLNFLKNKQHDVNRYLNRHFKTKSEVDFFQKKIKHQRHSIIQRSNALIDLNYEKNYQCCFLTMTSPPLLHHLQDIETAFELLKIHFQKIKQQLYADRIAFKFFKVFERHKSNMPHLHALFIIQKIEVQPFVNILKNKLLMKNGSFHTHKQNYYFNYKKQTAFCGRCSLQMMKKPKAVSAYLVKYLKKSFESKIDVAWKLYYKIRSFSFSKLQYPQYIIQKLYRLGMVKKILKQCNKFKSHLSNILYYLQHNVESFTKRQITDYEPLYNDYGVKDQWLKYKALFQYEMVIDNVKVIFEFIKYKKNNNPNFNEEQLMAWNQLHYKLGLNLDRRWL